MIQHIKNTTKKISRSNMIIWFCLGLFSFIVFQNSVAADKIITVPEYNSISMSQFLSENITNFVEKNIKESKEKYNKSFDLKLDVSLQKYISDKVLLKNKNYVPADLVRISSKNIVNKSWRPYLRQPAEYALSKLAEAFNDNFNKKLYLVSAYRTLHDQATLFEWWCSLNRCAKIWWSEHILWLAVDIHVATKNWYNKFNGETLKRMNKNAYKYGFINTYRKWLDVDWKMPEVWHWRYVWVPLATELNDKDLSFAEYYKLNLN